MKFIVDSLPYYGGECPFDTPKYDSVCRMTKCPQIWDKEFICSENNPHECEYLIEFDKYMESKNNEDT